MTRAFNALAILGAAAVGMVAGASFAKPPLHATDGRTGEVPDMGEGERGRDAVDPADVPTRGWRDILWRTFEQIGLDRVMAVAAGVTFYILLAIFPASTALVSLYGLFADRTTVAANLDSLSGLLPSGAIEILGEQLGRITSQPQDTLGIGFAVGLAVALWSANQGMKAIFDALNVAYAEREKRSFLALNSLSLAFTLAAIVLVLFALAAIVVLPIVLNYVGVGTRLDALMSLGRWPILAVGTMLIVSLIYRYGPSRRRAKWRWIFPGAILSSLVWIGASVAFSWYVTNFGSYNQTYGSLGAIIGFMTWIWVSTTIILVGAELNAELEHQTLRDTTTGSEKPMGARGAIMADTVGGAR